MMKSPLRVTVILAGVIALGLSAPSARSEPPDFTVESFNAEMAARRPQRSYEVEWEETTSIPREHHDGSLKLLNLQAGAKPPAPSARLDPALPPAVTHGHGVATLAGRADFQAKFSMDGWSGAEGTLLKDATYMEMSFTNGHSRESSRNLDGSTDGRVGEHSRWMSLNGSRAAIVALAASLLNPLDMIAPTTVIFDSGERDMPGSNTLRCNVSLEDEGTPGGWVHFYLDPNHNYRMVRVEASLNTDGATRHDIAYDDAGILKTIVSQTYRNGIADPKWQVTTTIKRITKIGPPNPEDLMVAFPAGARVTYPVGKTRTAVRIAKTPEDANQWIKEALRQ